MTDLRTVNPESWPVCTTEIKHKMSRPVTITQGSTEAERTTEEQWRVVLRTNWPKMESLVPSPTLANQELESNPTMVAAMSQECDL